MRLLAPACSAWLVVVGFSLSGCRANERAASIGSPDALVPAARPSMVAPDDAGRPLAIGRTQPPRLTRGERAPDAPLDDDHDLIDDSPPCKTRAALELRVDEHDERAGVHVLRASIKNCLAKAQTVLYQPNVAPLRMVVVDADGASVAITDERGNQKFDNTLRCPRPLGANQERLIEKIAIEDGVIRSDSFVARPKMPAKVALTFAQDKVACVEGGRSVRPGNVFVGKIDAPPILVESGRCECPDLVWRDGPALGSWTEHRVDSTCRWTTVTKNARHDGKNETCTARLSCEGPRGARALAALIDDAEVAAAFARDADFGAKVAMMSDRGAIHLERRGHNIGVAVVGEAPPPIRELVRFFDSERWLPDGGTVFRPVAATDRVCR